MKDLTYKTVCNVCYRKTWYKDEGPCQITHVNQDGEQRKCTGTLKVIDYSELPEKFKRAYETGERIRVKFTWGEVKTGTVGLTTGWRPAFLLIRNRNQHGSADILDRDVEYTREKCQRGR